jgi:hypothetical protein
MLSTIALAGVLAAAPAYAYDMSASAGTPYDRLAPPAGDALTRSDMRDASRMCCVDEQAADGAVIEGRVAAVEHESGRLVLDTHDGLVSLVTWPEQVAQVEVGDQVRVSFVNESD